MSSPTLAPPPREVRPRAPSPAGATHSSAATIPVRPLHRRQRDPFGRVLARALAISIAAHVVILLVSPLFIRVGDPPGDPAADAASPGGRAESGLRAITPIPTEGAGAGEAPPVVAERQPISVAPTPSDTRANASLADRPADRPDAPAVAPPAESGSGVGLRPGYSDPRLYVNPEPIPLANDQTRHERYMEHLAARIEALNDSTYGGPNTDWTVRDDEGRRWGLSEDGLHLGGVTIPRFLLPLPGATGTNQTIEEQRERQRQRDEIQRQEADRERDRIREERARAIREGRDGGG